MGNTHVKYHQKRPDHVKTPVTTTETGWVLGYAQPDMLGHTPNAGFHAGLDYDSAVAACVAEAGARGISPEAYEATVISSVVGNKFDVVLALLKKKKEKKS